MERGAPNLSGDSDDAPVFGELGGLCFSTSGQNVWLGLQQAAVEEDVALSLSRRPDDGGGAASHREHDTHTTAPLQKID